ncbi:MAG TPA: signal peptidase II [Tepidisphaeraceae bacterium]|nr:signal peptidase II [Tepidisphaeraceae bacterium]
MPVSRFFALRSPIALILFLATTVGGLAVDQWAKSAAFSRLCDGVVITDDGHAQVLNPSTERFIPGWLHFTAVANQGAVFGIGQGHRLLFIAVSIAAIIFIGYLFSISGRQRFYQVVLGMLMAGVLGNLYDRVTRGYVRDMVHALPHKFIFGYPAFPWIFNVADSLLCAGVALMLLHSFFTPTHAPGADAKAVRR